jgi:hypothetical protein
MSTPVCCLDSIIYPPVIFHCFNEAIGSCVFRSGSIQLQKLNQTSANTKGVQKIVTARIIEPRLLPPNARLRGVFYSWK